MYWSCGKYRIYMYISYFSYAFHLTYTGSWHGNTSPDDPASIQGPLDSEYNPTVHLTIGDVRVDNTAHPHTWKSIINMNNVLRQDGIKLMRMRLRAC